MPNGIPLDNKLLQTHDSHNLVTVSEKAAKKGACGNTGKTARDEGDLTGNHGEGGALCPDMVEAIIVWGEMITAMGARIAVSDGHEGESARRKAPIVQRAAEISRMDRRNDSGDRSLRVIGSHGALMLNWRRLQSCGR
jgi:hypothetical protein